MAIRVLRLAVGIAIFAAAGPASAADRPDASKMNIVLFLSDDHAAHRQTLETWRVTLTKRLADRPEGFSDGNKLIPGRRYRPLHPLQKTKRKRSRE